MLWLECIVAIGLLIYLVFHLINPEKEA
ncbi:potassium-transporting ATPase subunit F [Celerinatantimonas yamalensis]|uniref:Potassium-transporting ATPase subunit F n=1 Tax=Celerinatantimonas yamalensis TaxID=559956 RepID=A0ABW9G2R4_9GAMM